MSGHSLEILKKGMTTEIWGQRFYTQALERTTEETGKRVFQTLVEEENKHLDILIGQYAAISGSGEYVSIDEALRLAETVDPTTIFPEAASAERLIPPDATDEQALRMAMEFEQRGYQLYSAEAEASASREAEAMWQYLATAEDQHYTFLDHTLEYLTTNGTWYFDERELPFFEG